MNDLTSLTSEEKNELYKLPAYVSLLAASHDDKIDQQEKNAAVKLSHIKTYSCEPMLANFYWSADKVFATNLTQLDDELPKNREERQKAIRQAMAKMVPIISRLDDDFAAALYHSLESFKDHVAKAHNNIFEYFLFPMPIKGITS